MTESEIAFINLTLKACRSLLENADEIDAWVTLNHEDGKTTDLSIETMLDSSFEILRAEAEVK